MTILTISVLMKYFIFTVCINDMNSSFILTDKINHITRGALFKGERQQQTNKSVL